MKARWLVPVIFLIPAGGAGYMTWLSWEAGEDSKWIFGVFTVFFLLIALVPFLPSLKSKPASEPSPNTRFVPHWFMLLAILAMGAAAVFAVVGAILRR